MSWFSKGFPLEKAVQYAALRKPFLINDLDKQVRASAPGGAPADSPSPVATR